MRQQLRAPGADADPHDASVVWRSEGQGRVGFTETGVFVLSCALYRAGM
jgi:hypothetical protein